jgi:hypothetical protein
MNEVPLFYVHTLYSSLARPCRQVLHHKILALLLYQSQYKDV